MPLSFIRTAVPASALVVVLALGASACASDDAPTVTPASSGGPTTSASVTTLPGEPIDFGPAQGDVVAVVGVEHDSGLDVLSLPGSQGDVVATLDPLADDLTAQGEARQVDGSIWYLVAVGGVSGWVDSAFVQYLDGVDDVTSFVIADAGSTPKAEGMPDLGRVVAERLASTDPPSRITMAATASSGSVGEVVYDVVGLGDDSLGGLRLHVFGTPDDDGFVLKSVEQTFLCLRGVTDGVCL